MFFKRISTSIFLFLFIVAVCAQTALPRSTPEAQGVSSKGILAFIDAVEKTKNEMHSIMILRHGRVVAEGWWNPYRPDLKHTMYSLSKSFTSTAVGFAVTERKLKLDDKVISFFPDKVPDKVSEYLEQLTVKDLITMSVGQAPDPTGQVVITDDWIKTFFATPILNKPGSVFLYNSAATYMLSAIVQKITGQKIIDYLTSRLFKPLGIQGMDWETDPDGICVGGWGLRIQTEDIARFGQLYLQKGKWNGKQLLPASWAEEATTFKIDNAPGAVQSKKDSSDWMQGYCYQFWRSRHNSYRGDGAFGQYCLVLPDKDAVIAITSETPNMQDELNLVWQYLLPAMQAGRTTLNKNDAVALKKRLSSLRLPLPQQSKDMTQVPSLAGKTFKLETNEKHIENISFSLDKLVYTVSFWQGNETYQLSFSNGQWVAGETNMPGPSLVAAAKNHFVGLTASQVVGAYSWKDQSTLEMQLRYIDSPHTLYMSFKFDEDKATVEMLDSFKTPDKKIVIKGELVH